MTATAIADPGVTRLTSGAAAAAAFPGALLASASRTPEPGAAAPSPGLPAAFPALLLALRTPGRPAAPPADADGLPHLPYTAQAARSPTGLRPPAPAMPMSLPDPTAPEPVDPRLPASAAEQSLPPDGMILPPALALEAMLGSLTTARCAPSAPITVGPVTEMTTAISPAAVESVGSAAERAPPGLDAGTGKPGAAAVTNWHPGAPEMISAAPEAAQEAVDDRGIRPLLPVLSPADNASSRVESALSFAMAARAELPAQVQPLRIFSAGDSPPPLISASSAVAAPAGAALTLTTAAADDMPVLQPLADADAWAKGLGDRLLVMAENGMHSARLKLHPEHLGPLEVRIRVHDDGASQVWFSAHHPQTRDAIEHAIPRLCELFADQGLSLAQANVDSGRGTFAQHDLHEPLPVWSEGLGEDSDEVPARSALWQVARTAERRVDVLV